MGALLERWNSLCRFRIGHPRAVPCKEDQDDDVDDNEICFESGRSRVRISVILTDVLWFSSVPQ